MKKSLVIVPVNDVEAALIARIAKAANIDVSISRQQHGASIDRGRDYVKILKEGDWDEVVIVEMPGLTTEEKVEKMGIDVVIIDHHNYTGLIRAKCPRSGRMLKSSLEQFIKHFKFTDAKLKKLGFDPVLVKGVGIFDRSYIWGLQEEGYSAKQIEQVMDYQDLLMDDVPGHKHQEERIKAAKKIWEKKRKWKEYFIVENETSYHLRSHLSLLAAREFKKPTPLIVHEKKLKRIYVQECKDSMRLFEVFGGFTYGTHQNWGYRNDRELKKVSLVDVKKILEG
jgi:hypothetical protein